MFVTSLLFPRVISICFELVQFSVTYTYVHTVSLVHISGYNFCLLLNLLRSYQIQKHENARALCLKERLSIRK